MLDNKGKKYREWLIKIIQATVKDLEEMIPDLVGNTDALSNFEIHLKFSQDEIPTIELVREHLSKRAIDVLREPKKNSSIFYGGIKYGYRTDEEED